MNDLTKLIICPVCGHVRYKSGACHTCALLQKAGQK